MSADSDALAICNPGLNLRANAKSNPDKLAIVSPQGQLSYRELEERSNDYAFTLQKVGIQQGHKIILMIKPGIELYVLAFALFKCGAIPVVVDPGMGVMRMLQNYKSVSAEAFIGIIPAHIIRLCASSYFRTVKINLWIYGGRLFQMGGSSPANPKHSEFQIARTRPNALSIINFTTGSTGPAKPVEMTYGMVMATVKAIQDYSAQTADEVDMVTVPFFGVISLVIGSTIVIPPMNPAKPSEVNPRLIVETINTYKVSSLFASPALLERVGRYGKRQGIKLASLRNVNSGGAPISHENLQTFSSLLTNKGRMHSSWGATEGLPLASIPGDEILNVYQPLIRSGQGSPIGRILPGIQAKIIHSTEENIEHWSASLEVEAGEIGEVVVRGPNISLAYHMNPEANAAHKIHEQSPEQNIIWHRTGDLAWQNSDGILFFCGRKAHSFINEQGQALHSVACEGVANTHIKVKQSALVAVKNRPVMCLELHEKASKRVRDSIRLEVLALLRTCPSTCSIETILFHRKFPVDPRHNAKIERPKLAVWARHQLAGSRPSQHLAKLIPILGWMYLILGLLVDLPQGLWTIVWWIDLFISTVMHIMQIPVGIRVGSLHGYSSTESALRTFVLGATWWKPLRPQDKEQVL